MDWETKYKEYLDRFNSKPGYIRTSKSKPMEYNDFIRLHMNIRNNTTFNENIKQWFDI